jgi:hypothetical protein
VVAPLDRQVGLPIHFGGLLWGPPLARMVASHDWPTRISPSIKLWTLFACRRCNRVSNNKNPLRTLFACRRCNRVSNNKNPLWTLFACRRCNRVSNNKNPLWIFFACQRCNRVSNNKNPWSKIGSWVHHLLWEEEEEEELINELIMLFFKLRNNYFVVFFQFCDVTLNGLSSILIKIEPPKKTILTFHHP